MTSPDLPDFGKRVAEFSQLSSDQLLAYIAAMLEQQAFRQSLTNQLVGSTYQQVATGLDAVNRGIGKLIERLSGMGSIAVHNYSYDGSREPLDVRVVNR